MAFEECFKANVAVCIITLALLILFVVLLNATIRFYKAYKFTNVFMLLMFVTLNFALLARIGNLAGFLVIFYSECKDQDKNGLYVLRSFIPLYFLSAAVLFHMSSWILSIIDISSILNHRKCNRTFVASCLILLQLSNFVYYIFFMIYLYVNQEDKKIFKKYFITFAMSTSVEFSVIGVLFAATGVTLIMKIKQFSIKKWKVLRIRIGINIMLIFFLFLLRSIHAFLIGNLGLDRVFIGDSIKNDNWAFPCYVILWYTLEDFIPISIQIVLVGLIIKEFSCAVVPTVNECSQQSILISTFIDDISDNRSEITENLYISVVGDG